MTVADDSSRHKSLIRRWTSRRFLGWLAVAFSTLVASLWAFWEIIENFHEGWFHESPLSNLGLMFIQYLSPVIIFVSLTLLAIAFPRVGGVAHVLAGLLLLLLLFDLNDTVAMMFVIVPMLILGMLYYR